VGHDLGLAAPDVLVLDVHMPHGSGVDLLTELRRAGWRVPVVLMTAYLDDEVREAAVVWGAATVLEKPFSTDALETVLLNAAWLSERARSGPTVSLDRAAW
jgi:FixJ family two-component response regulator